MIVKVIAILIALLLLFASAVQPQTRGTVQQLCPPDTKVCPTPTPTGGTGQICPPDARLCPSPTPPGGTGYVCPPDSRVCPTVTPVSGSGTLPPPQGGRLTRRSAASSQHGLAAR